MASEEEAVHDDDQLPVLDLPYDGGGPEILHTSPILATTTTAPPALLADPTITNEESGVGEEFRLTTVTTTTATTNNNANNSTSPIPPTALDLPTTVYGVRYGKHGIQGCIFLTWEDCAPLVQDCQEAEYESFPSLDDAAKYIFQGRTSYDPETQQEQQPLGAGDATPPPPIKFSPQDNHNFQQQPQQEHPQQQQEQVNPSSPKRPLPISPTPTLPPLQVPENTNTTMTVKTAAENPSEKQPHKPPLTETPIKKKKKRKRSTQPQKVYEKPKKAPKYWMQQLDELKKFKEKFGHVNATNEQDPKVAKFVRDQRHEYSYMMQDKETKMFPDKIEKLNSLGFDFQYEMLRQEDDQKWHAMLQEFVQFHKQDSTNTIHKKQSVALRDWKNTQRLQFQNLQEGKRSTLTPDRIQKLNDAGFVFCPRSSFRVLTWDERIAQLEQFKAEHGHLNIPSTHPELGVWVSNIRRSYKYLQEGKKTGFTEEKASQLSAMGFSFLVGKRRTGPVEMKSWEEQFQLLLQFKKQYGHSVVPQHYPGLGRWVKQMRREFKLMKEGRRSTMTQEKVMKLADIGFVFDAQYRRGSKLSANDYTKVGGRKVGELQPQGS